MRTFRNWLAQINTTVGDLKGNIDRIEAHIERARALGCDPVSFTQPAIIGYPPGDLARRLRLVDGKVETLRGEVARTRGSWLRSLASA